jgi:hypothetical protein
MYLRIIAALAFFAAVPMASASGAHNRMQSPQLPTVSPKAGCLLAIAFGAQPGPEAASMGETAGSRDQAGRPLSRKVIRTTTSCSVC